MPGALLIVCGIAAVDMLNPGTVGPALVFALSSHPAQRVLQFAAGFLVVNFLGGVLLVLGPAKWLFGLIPDLGEGLKQALEIAGGIALLVAAALLLVSHRRLVGRDVERQSRGGSAVIAGAGIAAAELPTAFPYFAAIAAIEAADVSLPAEVLLVAVFNLIFLAPVFAIALLAGRFPSLLQPLNAWTSQHWPQVLAALLAAGGIALLVVGLT